LTAEDATLKPYTLQLGYEYWSAHDILHAILPEDLLDEAPSSFATVGHIGALALARRALTSQPISIFATSTYRIGT